MMFRKQADQCRRQASEFAGKPEAPFLLSVASAFDELAIEADARPAPSLELTSRISAPPFTA
jgi:hypothetical protein